MSEKGTISSEVFNEIIGLGMTIVVFYGGDWCGSSKVLLDKIDECAGSLGFDAKSGEDIYSILKKQGNEVFASKPRFMKLDADKHVWLAEKYEVRHVPQMIRFLDGKAIDRKIGAFGVYDIKKYVESECISVGWIRIV